MGKRVTNNINSFERSKISGLVRNYVRKLEIQELVKLGHLKTSFQSCFRVVVVVTTGGCF